MKRYYYILFILLLSIGVSIFLMGIKKQYIIEISLLTIEERPTQPNEFDEILNSDEWIILTNEHQKVNWERAGYIIPLVDFNKNFIIISRYKISSLYQKAGTNKCLGVPDGKAVFDKANSNTNFFYIYLMPTIMLSQGVG
jgi:hypothetical protein